MSEHDYIGKEVAGQFKILRRIGTGGMGAVYQAEQPEMNRHVAIKILHPRFLSRPDLVSRFRREARAMSHLSHPNTARVFLYGQLPDGACYIVMEYMEGRNLAQLIRAEGPMQPARAVRIMCQVCGALSEAHEGGIIHRDIKPENIFLTVQGGIVDFPKVLDFGLAKVTEREMRPGSVILTQDGMVFGTPEFMSPEQAQGEPLDPRSDIYSLGCVLYEILTGKLPFEASKSVEFLALQVQAPPIPLSHRVPHLSFPPGLEEVLMRALEKDPEQRYPRASDFAMALKGCLQDALDEHAMASVPRSEDSQRFLQEGVEAALRAQGTPPSTRPVRSDRPGGSDRPGASDRVRGNERPTLSEPPQGSERALARSERVDDQPSALFYAFLGASAMLILGGAVITALLLLR